VDVSVGGSGPDGLAAAGVRVARRLLEQGTSASRALNGATAPPWCSNQFGRTRANMR